MIKESEKVTMPEVRELLKAMEVLAVRPGDCTAETIGTCVNNFNKLLLTRTDGMLGVELVMLQESKK